MDNKSIKKLETDLWEAADLLRQGSKSTSQQYCMPVWIMPAVAKAVTVISGISLLTMPLMTGSRICK